jgi:hypothetical protein
MPHWTPPESTKAARTGSSRASRASPSTDFEAQDSGAFLLLGAAAMEGRFNGTTHRVDVGNRISYRSPTLTASLDPRTFDVLEATVEPTGSSMASLEPAAVMATLLGGLSRSRPHLLRSG